MAHIPPETIEQILAANDIVEVVGGYFPLKRAGAVWKALCPFHDERSPSFTVNPQRQIFKCFGCGAGGSAIRFVMTYENLDFVSAAKKLAERGGVRIEEAEMNDEDRARYSARRRLLALHAEAADFFHHYLLKRPSAQIAREYLKSRGISGDVAKSWKLGYAPDSWDTFSQWALQAGYTPHELIDGGLVKRRDEERRDSDFYDRFRNRVMFPICNDRGEVIAFSGRILEADAKAAKYVNSPESILFSKGAVLFGLHKSLRPLINKSSAIVCEGQLDLITAFEAGVQNVVAPQGTAFTPKQARKLKQYVGEVILCFDSDIAGQKAAERSLPALLYENLSVRVAEMPPGEDPDSLIRGQGVEAFSSLIAGARDFFDFQIDHLALQPDFATPRGRVLASRKLAEWVSLIADVVLREAIVHKVAQRLEISAAEFTKLLKAPRKPAASDGDAPAAPPPVAITLDPTLRLLAIVTLRDSDARAWIMEEAWRERLEHEPDSGLVVRILEADVRPEEPASINAFLSTLDAAEEAAVTTLLEERAPDHALAIAHDCWLELERRAIRRRMDSVKARMMGRELPMDHVAELQKQILDLQKRLSDIARPLSPPV
ncbi:MAG TPA: DNA primase [Chthoniobacteraceae bacterium]